MFSVLSREVGALQISIITIVIIIKALSPCSNSVYNKIQEEDDEMTTSNKIDDFCDCCRRCWWTCQGEIRVRCASCTRPRTDDARHAPGPGQAMRAMHPAPDRRCAPCTRSHTGVARGDGGVEKKHCISPTAREPLYCMQSLPLEQRWSQSRGVVLCFLAFTLQANNTSNGFFDASRSSSDSVAVWFSLSANEKVET